jgi:regulator of protease activity HflC (stomatin/prohibitin superfamily)
MNKSGSRESGPVYIGGKVSLPRFRFNRRSFGNLIILGIVVVVALVFMRWLFAYVPPGSYGIKEVKIGMNRGIQEWVYGPGYWFVKPFGIEVIHTLPQTVQVLELTQSERGYESPAHTFDRAAKIQTSDGFFVDVDVSILYRIADPYKVVTVLGPGTKYLENGIRPKAEPMLKQSLGELTTEDFFNSPLRTQKAERTRELLNLDLAPKGLRVDHVLVRYFKYTDEIQKNIEAKKLQDQLVFKNEAQARAAIEQAKLARVEQEGEMNVKVTLQEGEAYRIQKEAERDLYVRTREAEGELLVKTAEADAIELKSAAMQTAGSDRKVALEMAEVLRGLDVLIVPSGGESGLNPLDLTSVLTLFGVESTNEPPRPSPAPPARPVFRPAPIEPEISGQAALEEGGAP